MEVMYGLVFDVELQRAEIGNECHLLVILLLEILSFCVCVC